MPWPRESGQHAIDHQDAYRKSPPGRLRKRRLLPSNTRSTGSSLQIKLIDSDLNVLAARRSASDATESTAHGRDPRGRRQKALLTSTMLDCLRRQVNGLIFLDLR